MVDSMEVVRLADAAHRMEVSICPQVGNIGFDMKVNGQAILMPPAHKLSEWTEHPSQAGIPFLAPWANRLDGDAYWANSKKYLVNPEVVGIRRDPNGQPIHGLLLFASGWEVAKVEANADGAVLVSRLEFWRRPEWMAQFPFAHTIEMTYKLSKGVLEVRTAVENHSREAMPLVIGFHPWYQIPGSPRDEWTVHLPVRDHYLVSPRVIPTGKTEPVDFPDPTPLLGRQFDDVFGGVNHDDEFWVESKGRRISVRFGPKFPVAVIYAPKTRDVVCFEPMTGITNGFNLAHDGVYSGLQSVPAGGTWSESFWVRASGF